LLNNSARSAPAPVDDTLSRAQKAKKLKAVYEKLSCEGFTNDQIELVLSALKVTLPTHSSLCLVTAKIKKEEKIKTHLEFKMSGIKL
jgi:hypothetical protein